MNTSSYCMAAREVVGKKSPLTGRSIESEKEGEHVLEVLGARKSLAEGNFYYAPVSVGERGIRAEADAGYVRENVRFERGVAASRYYISRWGHPYVLNVSSFARPMPHLHRLYEMSENMQKRPLENAALRNRNGIKIKTDVARLELFLRELKETEPVFAGKLLISYAPAYVENVTQCRGDDQPLHVAMSERTMADLRIREGSLVMISNPKSRETLEMLDEFRTSSDYKAFESALAGRLKDVQSCQKLDNYTAE